MSALRNIETTEDYETYTNRVEEWLSEVVFPSTGDSCGFSNSRCDICHRPLAGDRHEVKYFADQESTYVETDECCTDCLYYLNYGSLDDQTMLNIHTRSKS